MSPRKCNTLTVGELKEELELYPDDMKVYFSYNYGDHWRTEVAAEIVSVEKGEVEYSDYHSMMKVRDDVDPGEGDVLILSREIQ